MRCDSTIEFLHTTLTEELLAREEMQTGDRGTYSDDSQLVSVLSFRIGDTRFCMEARSILAIVAFAEPSPVPFLSNRFLLGVTSHYGRVAPLFSLAAAMEIEMPPGERKFNRTIFIQFEGVMTGIPVSSVEAVFKGRRGEKLEGQSEFTSATVYDGLNNPIPLLSPAEIHTASKEGRI